MIKKLILTLAILYSGCLLANEDNRIISVAINIKNECKQTSIKAQLMKNNHAFLTAQANVEGDFRAIKKFVFNPRGRNQNYGGASLYLNDRHFCTVHRGALANKNIQITVFAKEINGQCDTMFLCRNTKLVMY